jgi:hypothetical protein
MSQDNTVNPQRFIAGADLSASTNLYKAVKLDASGYVVLATAGTRAIGILHSLGVTGVAVAVAIDKSSKAVAGGVITSGDKVKPSTLGTLISVTNTNGIDVLGEALESAVSGDVFEIFIDRDKF